MNQQEKIVDGKTITTTEHEDGRKDVHIEVQSLDVDLSDPSNVAAKKVIEEQVIPTLANKKILVTLIHKPTNEHVNYIAFLPKVRENALKFIAEREDQMLDHYCLVQNDNGEVTVTSL